MDSGNITFSFYYVSFPQYIVILRYLFQFEGGETLVKVLLDYYQDDLSEKRTEYSILVPSIPHVSAHEISYCTLQIKWYF